MEQSYYIRWCWILYNNNFRVLDFIYYIKSFGWLGKPSSGHFSMKLYSRGKGNVILGQPRVSSFIFLTNKNIFEYRYYIMLSETALYKSVCTYQFSLNILYEYISHILLFFGLPYIKYISSTYYILLPLVTFLFILLVSYKCLQL